MKNIYSKKLVVALITFCFVFILDACKKDKDDSKEPFDGSGVHISLPSGSSLNLGQTSLYTLSKSFPVSSNGNTSVQFNENTHELAYLFDTANKVMLMGFISNDNKEISINTTAEVLLYYGMGITANKVNEDRIAAIKKLSKYPQFTEFADALAKLFVADPYMLSKGNHLESLVKTVNDITNNPPIDLFASQIEVEEADQSKSGLIVRPKAGDDENIEIENSIFRRGHAFLYKTGYKDKNNASFTLISSIDGSTPPTMELPVNGCKRFSNPEISGPTALPLQSHESSSTWKVRIVGVGGDILSLSTPKYTNQEKAKLEEMWHEFFAVDLLLPFMLDVLDQRSDFWPQVHPNNIELVRPFVNKTKEYALDYKTIDQIKAGAYTSGVTAFLKQLADNPYRWEELATLLIASVQGKTGKYVQYAADVKAEFAKTRSILQIITDATDPKMAVSRPNSSLTYIHDMYDDEQTLIHQNCYTLEEWTVTSRDNDVTITPKNSQAMVFVNHTLSVSASASLGAGETIEYTWTTPGNFGVLKDGTLETTTVTTTGTTVTYYGKTTPNADNFEKVYVTAYIKNANGRREIGKDTATINVKKLKIVMKPDGATLSPVKGVNSIKLYLLNADGTNPIVNGSAVQYKVEWSIGGSYGHLDGGSNKVNTSSNSTIYTATDEDVKSGVETVTARVYFKLASTGWIFREEVKGKVNVSNDLKKIVYYTSPRSFHSDRNGWHYTGCGVVVQKMDKAVSYGVAVTGLLNKNYPTYNDSWSVTGKEDHIRGYQSYVMPLGTEAGDDYITGVYGTFSWGSCSSCAHTVAVCSGTAEITVFVAQ